MGRIKSEVTKRAIRTRGSCMKDTNESGKVAKRQMRKSNHLKEAMARLLKTQAKSGEVMKGNVSTRQCLRKATKKQVRPTEVTRRQVKSESKSAQVARGQAKSMSKSTQVAKRQVKSESKLRQVAKRHVKSESKSRQVAKRQVKSESKSRQVARRQVKSESKSRKEVKRQATSESKSRLVAYRQPNTVGTSTNKAKRQSKRASSSIKTAKGQLKTENKSGKVVKRQTKAENKSTNIATRQLKLEGKSTNVKKRQSKPGRTSGKVAERQTKTETKPTNLARCRAKRNRKSTKVTNKQQKMGSQSSKVDIQPTKRPPITMHDIKLLDLAFAMDCTGSMGSYIDSARDNIRKIVEEIVASEKSDVRLALVEYRDHPPQETSFVTRVHDFTSSPSTMRKWLCDSSARGGGDLPEAVADALHDVLKLNWRDEATKICVCVSDAPPHGLDSIGDCFPNGCPEGIDPMVVANQLAEKGVTLYVAGCEPSLGPYKDFFMAIAYITGGQYVPLTQAQVLTRIIVGGAQEEMSLEQFRAEVDQEVDANIETGIEMDEEEVTRVIHSRMKSKGIRTKQLRMNKAKLTSVADSPVAKKFSRMKEMGEVRVTFNKAKSAKMCSSSSPSRVKKMCTRKAGKKCSRVNKGIKIGGKAKKDSYDTVEDTISLAQVCRMVKKSIGGKAGRVMSRFKK